MSETLLQKLWLRGEFDRGRARLTSGELLRVIHPGTWNRLAGPDFHGAKLAVRDRVLTGDVEVHFHAEAWAQHGHDQDPAYENVILHVVLFPPRSGSPPACTRSGRAIPTLVLVDLLWHDLEEYASDEAVEALSGRDPFPLLEELLALPPAQRATRLADGAERRWLEKRHFARRRIERLGWNDACHLTTLEILGYRSNRVAMMRVATVLPWARWQERLPTLEQLTAVASGEWTLRGVRPANQPQRRLEQYRTWISVASDWPVRVRTWRVPELPEDAPRLPVAALRRSAGLPRVRAALAETLSGNALVGTRLDTWICNLLLPFRAAITDSAGETEALFTLWRAWYAGDAPAVLLEAVRQLGEGGGPATRANGLVQALLGLQLAKLSAAAVPGS